MNIKCVAIDLVKNVFHVRAVNAHNKSLFNKRLRHSQFTQFMQQIPASDLYMEAYYQHITRQNPHRHGSRFT